MDTLIELKLTKSTRKQNNKNKRREFHRFFRRLDFVGFKVVDIEEDIVDFEYLLRIFSIIVI